jgi:hypothetical protein
MLLIFSWLVAGIITSGLAITGLLNVPWLSILGLLPLLAVGFLSVGFLKTIPTFTFVEKIMCIVLVSIWGVHAIGLLTPEVGFDAVWYHLPVLHLMIKAGGLTYNPEWYQTLNPVFSDLFFSWGYVALGELGAKVTAYVLALSWAGVTYKLFRSYVPRNWALGGVIIASLFQPVAWQASSFYIDIARSFWEVSALFVLLTFFREKKPWQIVVAGLCFGAALASKLFVVVLLPFWLIAVCLSSREKRLRNAVLFGGCALLVVVPFWMHTAHFGGSPWYPLQMGSDALSVIGGASSWSAYIWEQSIKLWWAPWYLSISRDYISPLITWCLPLVFLIAWRYRKSLKSLRFWQSRQRLLVMIPIIVGEMVVWWYLPPVSSRYALTGFVCLWLVEVMAVREILAHMNPKISKQFMKLVVVVWCGAVIFGLLPRLGVTAKTLFWISKGANRERYYQQARDGWIDTHLDRWLELYRDII